jgi:hypothetical protein
VGSDPRFAGGGPLAEVVSSALFVQREVLTKLHAPTTPASTRRLLQTQIETLTAAVVLTEQQLQSSLRALLQHVRSETPSDLLARTQQIVDRTPLRAFDERRAALFEKTAAAVFQGTEWLTAEQVGSKRSNSMAKNPHAAGSRWRKDRRIFGLVKGGKTLYPLYVFTEDLEPRRAVSEVLRIFQDRTPLRIAAWFESTNSMLHGQRPREVLAADPEAVIRAARTSAVGPVHG